MSGAQARPEARRTADATLAQLRVWHESRFGARPAAPTRPLTLIRGTGSNGRTVLIDADTGEVVDTDGTPWR